MAQLPSWPNSRRDVKGSSGGRLYTTLNTSTTTHLKQSTSSLNSLYEFTWKDMAEEDLFSDKDLENTSF